LGCVDGFRSEVGRQAAFELVVSPAKGRRRASGYSASSTHSARSIPPIVSERRSWEKGQEALRPWQTTRAGRPGCRGLPLLGGGGLLLCDGLFLAKLELRLRKDIELQGEASVLVLEGDAPRVLGPATVLPPNSTMSAQQPSLHEPSRKKPFTPSPERAPVAPPCPKCKTCAHNRLFSKDLRIATGSMATQFTLCDLPESGGYNRGG
jgi:hypothetical protein